jgi:hypothetical protein
MSDQEIIFTSKFPDVDIPVISLPEFLLDRMPKFGNKPALIDSTTGNSLSFAQLTTLIKQVMSRYCDNQIFICLLIIGSEVPPRAK